MKNKITVQPSNNLAMTLEYSNLKDIRDFNMKYFKETFDIESFMNGIMNMSEYLQQQLDFYNGIDPKQWELFIQSLDSGKSDDFWNLNLIKIESEFDKYIFSGTNVSFLDYYKEEIDKSEDNRIHAIIYYLMDEVKHTPEVLRLLAENDDLFRLMYPHLTMAEITNIVKLNKLHIENGRPVSDYVTGLLGDKYGK